MPINFDGTGIGGICIDTTPIGEVYVDGTLVWTAVVAPTNIYGTAVAVAGTILGGAVTVRSVSLGFNIQTNQVDQGVTFTQVETIRDTTSTTARTQLFRAPCIAAGGCTPMTLEDRRVISAATSVSANRTISRNAVGTRTPIQSGNITYNLGNAVGTPSSYSVTGNTGTNRIFTIRVTANTGFEFLDSADITIALPTGGVLLGRNLISTQVIEAQVQVTISSTAASNVTVTGNAVLAPAVPSVTTIAATAIATNAATLNGTLDNLNRRNVTRIGFLWGLSAGSLGNDLARTVTFTTAPRDLGRRLIGLSGGQTIFYRAYADNSVGRGFGAILSFTTDAISAPSVGTLTAIDVTDTQARLRAQIISTGGAPITSAQFEYGIGAFTNTIVITSFPTLVLSTLSGLMPSTTYQYRFTATNAGGTANGGTATFTTDAVSIIPATAGTVVSTGAAIVFIVSLGGLARVNVNVSPAAGAWTLDIGTPGITISQPSGTGDVNNIRITAIAGANIPQLYQLTLRSSNGTFLSSIPVQVII